MTTERLILVYASTEEEFQSFMDFLKKHFLSATCIGINHNDREPFKGGCRGYVTLVGEAKEGKSRE